MICKECGQELSKDSIFCNKCGTKIETTVQEPVGKVQITQEKVVDNTKKIDGMKILLVGVVVLVVLIIVFALFGGSGRDYHGTNTPTYAEDDFGANNEIVTQPLTTEPITAAPVDIEVIYPEILKDGADKKARVVDYKLSYNQAIQMYTLKVTFEKVSYTGTLDWGPFATSVYAYDETGNLIDSSMFCVNDFPQMENGEQFSATYTYYVIQNSGQLATIELENYN